MSEQIINCKTPGKVILHGEHAVVYGKNAIALSVDLKTNVQIRLNKEGNDVKLLLNNFNASTFWTINSLSTIKLIEEEQKLNKVLDLSDQLIEKLPKCETSDSLSIDVINSFNAFLLLYIGISDSYCSSTRISMEVTVSTSLPCGAGLGSSSSYIVSLTAALLRAYNLNPEPKLISEWSFQIDKLFHGRPSGIDNSICTFGGALLFRNGKIEEQIQNVEPLPVILVNTKVTRNTKALVEKLRQKYQKFPQIIDNIMSAIDQISLNAWELVKKCSDFESLAALFEMNHHLLNSLGVGHSAIDKIVGCATKHGLSAKLTGAGGGGTVIILNNIKNKQIIDSLYNDLNDYGFEYWSVLLGCSGVSLE